MLSMMKSKEKGKLLKKKKTIVRLFDRTTCTHASFESIQVDIRRFARFKILKGGK